MNIECKLEKRVSNKSGNEYWCLYIPDIEKVIFLNQTELKLLQVLKNNK